jgi:DnaA family protein
MPSQQLTLNVALKDGFRFDSYYAAADSENDQTVKMLQSFLTTSEQQQNILWGESHSGKTHLLQACCAKAAENKQLVSYLPLKTLLVYGPEVVESLSQSQLVVVDDIDTVLGDKGWETALFNLINRCRDAKRKLLLSSQQNPRLLECLLPDLASRLIWGGSYQLHALSDEEKPKALQARANQRGFELSDRVIEYLFRRYPRDIESLMEILNKLDEESLRQKTVITVPFLKQILE